MIAVDKGTRFGIHILDTIGFIILLIGHAFLFDGVLRHGWHDSISETTVIKADSSATPTGNI